MESSERVLALVDRLRTTEHVTVTDLAAETGASEMTIRRDLDQLADQGVLRRVRGGAVSLLLRGEATPFAVREHEAVDTKRRIAAKTDELLTDGEAVILDGGTTTLTIARTLTRRRLTVVPLDMHSANALTGASDVRLLVPGGRTTPGALAFTGPLTEASWRPSASTPPSSASADCPPSTASPPTTSTRSPSSAPRSPPPAASSPSATPPSSAAPASASSAPAPNSTPSSPTGRPPNGPSPASATPASKSTWSDRVHLRQRRVNV